MTENYILRIYGRFQGLSNPLLLLKIGAAVREFLNFLSYFKTKKIFHRNFTCSDNLS